MSDSTLELLKKIRKIVGDNPTDDLLKKIKKLAEDDESDTDEKSSIFTTISNHTKKWTKKELEKLKPDFLKELYFNLYIPFRSWYKINVLLTKTQREKQYKDFDFIDGILQYQKNHDVVVESIKSIGRGSNTTDFETIIKKEISINYLRFIIFCVTGKFDKSLTPSKAYKILISL